ncbi:MAG: ABC transporter ATP-binding protein [Lachnospiraceae bacterium]|nr:ABC transporter ATP-binding protein [Lachnospiraceae bacterium]
MRIEKLSAGYHKKIIVSGVSFEAGSGEILSLIGPNGGGKSTLLKSIYGELTPMEGAVYIEDRDLRNISLKELSKMLSIVNTDRVKPEHMSAFDVVMSGRLPYSDGFGLFSDSDREAAERAVGLMKIEAFAEKPFMDLSDGQKQRTLIARAIAQEPKYLIMDEPTSYLDIRYRMELMDVIRKLADQGVTVIASLHELELALMISDRVLMINSEGAVSCREPREVLESGVLQGLYGMTDEMYRRVKRQLEAGMTGE